MENKDLELVNYLRVTSALEISDAKSGHTGICLGSAPLAYSMYKNAFINPQDPDFISRDRIVFSAGHASALCYALLHLFGYDCTIEDLKSFRKLGSRTSGHPEVGVTAGVDAQTGPLGQGVAMAVGMAIAEEFLRNKFKKEKFSPVEHYTYCMVGDGCLMEGIAQEAISIAGKLKLNKLIILYDSNNITIEGERTLANDEKVSGKFKACGFNVLHVKDGNSVAKIDKAIAQAQKSEKPTLIIVNTTIGFGSAFKGSASIHGKALDKENIQILKNNLSYTGEDYVIPKDLMPYRKKLLNNKKKLLDKYTKQLSLYKAKYKEDYDLLLDYLTDKNVDFSKVMKKVITKEDILDFRNKGHEIFNSILKVYPNMLGGTADLSPSTKCFFEDEGYFNNDKSCRNIAFGIREHAMAGICNGIVLHGGLRSFCSTFLTFANYMTPAIRLSAMMNVPVLYYFTHDTLAVGEDGPTHQPVEQLSTLRSMPNLYTFRPCCEREMFGALQYYFDKSSPVAICLPRQKIKRLEDDYELSLKGGYVIKSCRGYDITIVACGSEVPLAMEASHILLADGIKAKIVSLPCSRLFDEQPKDYRDSVISRDRPVFCIECSSDNIWYKYATSPSFVYTLNSFGKSGEYHEVLDDFGFTESKFASFIKRNLRYSKKD